ncbi:MAG: hypothetical protein J6Y08_03525 [Clostridiales bacterium]|nr:hypothetical protein [Clostridiales bacterium]
MKKMISALLCAAMIIGCTSCTHETEETKKKKKKKTEKTTTEETIDTDDTETEPSESDTSDTTDASSSETSSSPSGKIPDKIETLGLQYVNRQYLGYGYYDENSDSVLQITCMYDDLFIEDDYYVDLQNAIDGEFFESEQAVLQKYDEQSEEFFEHYSAGEDQYDIDMQFRMNLFREDSLLISFCFVDGENEIHPVNYFSQTAEKIELSDVIVDKTAAKDYIAYCLNSIMYDDYYDAFCKAIDNDSLQFCLTYDAICLICETDTEGEVTFAKIPVVGVDNAFNQELFGNAPKCFSLFSSSEESLIWDFDEDGTPDTLSVNSLYDDDSARMQVEITLNNYTYSSKDDGLEMNSYYVSYYTIMRTDDGYYLYLVANSVDSMKDIYIFKLMNGEFKYIDVMYNYWFYDTTYIDPTCFRLECLMDVMGFAGYTNEFYVVGNHGIPDYEYDTFVGENNVYVTKCDIAGTQVDYQNLDDLGDITIPAGMAVRVYFYAPQYDTLMLEVLSPSSLDYYLVQLTVEYDDDDWTYSIGGTPIDELFYGVFYAG